MVSIKKRWQHSKLQVSGVLQTVTSIFLNILLSTEGRIWIGLWRQFKKHLIASYRIVERKHNYHNERVKYVKKVLDDNFYNIL